MENESCIVLYIKRDEMIYQQKNFKDYREAATFYKRARQMVKSKGTILMLNTSFKIATYSNVF